MKEKIKLWGYTIYRNGDIYTPNGKLITKRKMIYVKIEGETKYTEISYVRLIYYAFNKDIFDFNDKTIAIRKKDKNGDYNLDNLEMVSKKDYVQGEKNAQSKLTDKQVEEIKNLYNSKKQKEGHLNNPNCKISYRKLAQMYGVTHTTISSIIKGEHRNKENYKL